MTEHVFTRRLTAQERRTLNRMYGNPQEPALGTVDQRLGILVRRLGGHTRPPRMTERERRDYAEWCRDQGVPNPLDEQ